MFLNQLVIVPKNVFRSPESQEKSNGFLFKFTINSMPHLIIVFKLH